jgi:hypothetical protein
MLSMSSGGRCRRRAGPGYGSENGPDSGDWGSLEDILWLVLRSEVKDGSSYLMSLIR